MSELPALTTNFLGQLGIDIADVAKQPNGKPDFHFSDPLPNTRSVTSFLLTSHFALLVFAVPLMERSGLGPTPAEIAALSLANSESHPQFGCHGGNSNDIRNVLP